MIVVPIHIYGLSGMEIESSTLEMELSTVENESSTLLNESSTVAKTLLVKETVSSTVAKVF